MSDTHIKLEQCKVDIAKLEEERTRLERQLKNEAAPKPRVGDITHASCYGGTDRRLIVNDIKGNLYAMTKSGIYISNSQQIKEYYYNGTYKLIGNVFDENFGQNK